jgi:hypothetical protein
MDSGTLEAFVDHARSTLESDPGMSSRTAELRITQPFLEALGWDVHGSEVEAGYQVGDEVIGFALGRGNEPSVFVQTVAPETAIDRDTARRFVASMRNAGVEWGILLNCRTFSFVASAAGSLESVEFSLEELEDHYDAVSYYERDAVLEREANRQATRQQGAERLAERYDDLTAEITTVLVDVLGEELRSEASAATEDFVRKFVSDLRATDSDGVAEDVPGPVPAGQAGVGPNDGSPEAPATENGSTEGLAEARTGTSTSVTRVSATGSNADAPESDHEYVVRFFDGGTSIGAVKAASLPGVLEQAITYLDEGRQLLSSLSIPWSPEDDPRSIIAHEPTHPDGSPMAGFERLSSGHVVFTDLGESDCREVIDALASRIGLRVMFQGDWAED